MRSSSVGILGKKKPALKDEDLEAVTACQRGDVEAFETIVRKYQKQMFNIAYRMIGNYEDAEDAVQIAFESAFKKISTFKRESKFATWLTKIMFNMSRNQIRTLNTRKNQSTRSLDDGLHTDTGEIKLNPPTNAPSPQQKMESKQLQQQVQWCINRIDERFREVLVLKDIQGFAYAEIGTVLDIPNGSVKSKLHRARGSLKNCLKKLMEI